MSFFGKPSGAEPRITYERIDLAADGAMLAPAFRQAPVLPAAPRPAPAAATVVRSGVPEPVTMLIAADSEVEGRLRSRGAVRIEGVLRGELQAASVVIEPGGLIEGLVTVEHAVVHGTLRGTLVARDIEISRTAMVDAELVYEEIGIERGARVHGLHRRREPAEAPPLPVAAEPQPVEEAALQTAALVAAAEAALQDLAEVAQAAAGASAALAQDGVQELLGLDGTLRDAAAGLPPVAQPATAPVAVAAA
jgi:cytoskeletal protein CcmA (bactofilin family)